MVDVTVAAALGEVKALRVLDKQHATSGDRHAVLTVLILLGAAVVKEPLVRVMLTCDRPRWTYWTIIGDSWDSLGSQRSPGG